MIVGVCRVTISIAGSYSLKDKRRVVKSIVERIRHRFNVSIAEVDEHEVWNAAVLAIVCVSTASAHVEEMLSTVVRFVEQAHPDAEVVDAATEIMSGF
jgi:uncharacterized protein YlxP (DUF503 family)